MSIIARSAAVLVLGFSVVLSAQTRADDKFPTKTITWIVDFPAGGISDTLARRVGQKLSEAWNVPVIVDNKPKANGVIAYEAVARAQPDGYTIGLVSTPLALAPSLRAKLPFEARNSFAPLAMIAESPNVLIANAQLQVKTVPDLLNLAKTRATELNYASVGVGSSPHMTAEMLKAATGMKATHIPYNGSGPALIDLTAGRVDFMFVNLLSAIPHVRSGTVVALGVSDVRRTPLLPDAPTMIEAGIPDFLSIGWYGVMAPAGLSPEIAARYNAEINRILEMPDVRETIAALGAQPASKSIGEFTAFFDQDIQHWAKVVKDTGVRIDN